MDTKKISVNPAFLKINGSKTLKKRREKNEESVTICIKSKTMN